MKSNTIITIVGIIVLLVGLVTFSYLSKGGSTELNSNIISSLSVNEESYSFGTISMKDGNVSKDFEITNSSNEDVNLKTILTSCMCTNAYLVKLDGSIKGPFGMSGHGGALPANELIKAGENRIIRVVFDPNAHGPAGVGQIDRLVTLTDSAGGQLQLEIKATVTP